MKIYDVLVRIEAYERVEADSLEEAEIAAVTAFDPTAYDAEVIEAYEIDCDEDDR
jgi:hypothetical protein